MPTRARSRWTAVQAGSPSLCGNRRPSTTSILTLNTHWTCRAGRASGTSKTLPPPVLFRCYRFRNIFTTTALLRLAPAAFHALLCCRAFAATRTWRVYTHREHNIPTPRHGLRTLRRVCAMGFTPTLQHACRRTCNSDAHADARTAACAGQAHASTCHTPGRLPCLRIRCAGGLAR